MGLAGLGLAHSYGVALASRAVWLVGYRFAFICVFTAMAVGTPEKYRSRTMGVLGAMAALASVIGAPFGTRLAEWIGWRGGIFGFAVIALVGGGALFAIPLPPRYSRRTTCRIARTRPHRQIAVCSAQSSHVGTDTSWLDQYGRIQCYVFRALRGESVFGLTASESATIISCQLPVCHLPQSRGRRDVRSLFPLEHFDPSAALLFPRASRFFRMTCLFSGLESCWSCRSGHAATNQIYAICGSVLTREEIGAGMGIVGLGSGIFGYLGPQMLRLSARRNRRFRRWLALRGRCGHSRAGGPAHSPRLKFPLPRRRTRGYLTHTLRLSFGRAANRNGR